ncbi:hypothetical protein R3W88_033026 [Solanum pinnatisectum]|uniref:Uncharacterized protein n=1 Tax=Solanum pinnatisectum TaxID=50273 RepID=A0AAV9K2B1_9SOLN|nr:hypothetical protein R3W88_033026 [Solanum pinnatisectum]
MNSRLACWKTNFLNMTGRTVLAKASLSSIPSHIMQFIKLPCKTTKALDIIQRNFLRGTNT